MQREIKFRAWDKSIEYMDYRVRVTTEEDETTVDVLDGFTKWRKLDDFILMQFTGLHDKKGKPIYEGDIILRDGIKYLTVIYFDNTECQFATKSTKTGMCYGIGTGIEDELEVIGNIHDNPELLSNSPLTSSSIKLQPNSFS